MRTFHLVFGRVVRGVRSGDAACGRCPRRASRASPIPSACANRVACNGVEPRIKFSETVINFGQKIILREGYRAPYVFEFTVSHNEPPDRRVTTELRQTRGRVQGDGLARPRAGHQHGVQRAEPRRGVPALGQSTTVKCTFFPRDAMLYAAVVPVYLDGGAKTKSTYLEFEVNGEGAHPRLAF